VRPLNVIGFYAKSGIFYVEAFADPRAMRRRLARLAGRILRLVEFDE
jgi:hypothetical protein